MDPTRGIDAIRDGLAFNDAVIVNEADRLLTEHVRLFSMLDSGVRAHLILTATTAAPFVRQGGQLLGRCLVLQTESPDEGVLRAHLARVYAAETGRELPDAGFAIIQADLRSSESSGRTRNALTALERFILSEAADTDE